VLPADEIARGRGRRVRRGLLLSGVLAGLVWAGPARAVTIVAPPAGADRAVGEAHTFTVRAETGRGALHYRWQKDGVNLPHAVTDSLTLDPVDLDDAGRYVCVVSDAAGQDRSPPATLTVFGIASPPADGVCPPGQRHTFAVKAAGGNGAPIAYQWYKDNVAVPGATRASLTLNPVRIADAGVYACTVSQGDNTLTSEPAVLQTSPCAILFDAHPAGATVYEGDAHTFAVAVSGGVPPFQYQWRHDGLPIPDATTARYDLATVTPTDAGRYDCLVSDAGRQVPSHRAMLRVAKRLTVATSPTGGAQYVGGAHTFRVTVAGGIGERRYRWRRDGAAVAGATGPALAINPLALAHAGTYACTVADRGGGVAVSEEAQLEVADHLVVTAPPAGGTVYVGDAYTLEVAVTGGLGAVQYQWRKDGRDLGEARAAAHEIGAVTAADAGVYTCFIRDDGTGVLTTAGAELAVFRPPSIVLHPAGGTRYVGARHAFTVEATGGQPPLRYQWQRDGLVIPGATAARYALESLAPGDAAPYTCHVADAGTASTVSREAALTVVEPVAIAGQPYGGDYFTGEAHSFSVVAAGGAGPLFYQWQRDGEHVPGATKTAYTIDPLAEPHAGTYTCVVRDAATAAAVTGPVIVTVIPPPVLADTRGLPTAE